MSFTKFLGLCALILCTQSALAQGKTDEDLKDLVKVNVSLSSNELAAGEKTFAKAVFAIKEGWHIYSDPPGEAGLPTRLLVKGTESLTPGKIEWPKPEVVTQHGGIVTNLYSNKLEISLPIETSSTATQDNAIPFEIQAKWLACSEDLCVPGSQSFKQEVHLMHKD